jgi:predicted metal-dependent phosphoesterase TrpH
VHSNCSDGQDSVEAVLRAAVRLGYFGLSIIDHDTLRGSQKALKVIREERLDLVLITGAEVTTSEGHLLCLVIEELPPRGLSRRRRGTYPASRGE